MTDDEGVGQRVRELRKNRGLSQAQLSGAGLSGSYVSLIEAGKRLATERALALLAERLGTTVEYLRDGVDKPPEQEARLQLAWAQMALNNGAPRDALTTLLPLLRQLPADPDARWQVRFLTGLAHEALGDLEQALETLEVLRAEAETQPSTRWLKVVVALCRCYREGGDLSYSIELADSAVRRVESLNLQGTDEHAEVAATLVASLYERGDLQRASLLARELVRATAQSGPRAKAAAFWNSSVVAQEQGRLAEAVDLAQKALTHLELSDQARNKARLKLLLGGLLLRADPPAVSEGLELLVNLEESLRETGSQVDIAYWETELARGYLLAGDAARAAEVAGRALERLGDAPRLETARALLVLGQALRNKGEVDEAIARLRHAAQLLDHHEANRQSAAAWNELGGVLTTLGEHREAVAAYQRALAAAGFEQALSVSPLGR